MVVVVPAGQHTAMLSACLRHSQPLSCQGALPEEAIARSCICARLQHSAWPLPDVFMAGCRHHQCRPQVHHNGNGATTEQWCSCRSGLMLMANPRLGAAGSCKIA